FQSIVQHYVQEGQSTSTGEGPSIGGRGMVLALVLFPIAFVITGLLNTGVLFLSLRSLVSMHSFSGS
ncbi:MAG: hypothetical protein Q8R42_07030, partial [Desulfocapsaceae bacterium]|nr:hypothetical protein [Desulfocapsaceae bacterium]